MSHAWLSSLNHMKNKNPSLDLPIESLEARTLLSSVGVTPILDFTQYNDPEIHCAPLTGGPHRPCLILAGRITGQIFDDANGNGVKDAGETGVEGAAVNLEAPNGDATRSLGQRITNSLGEFAFGR